jgi:hypothetical protein
VPHVPTGPTKRLLLFGFVFRPRTRFHGEHRDPSWTSAAAAQRPSRKTPSPISLPVSIALPHSVSSSTALTSRCSQGGWQDSDCSLEQCRFHGKSCAAITLQFVCARGGSATARPRGGGTASSRCSCLLRRRAWRRRRAACSD